MSETEEKRVYRAIYYRTKKYGWAKKEELLKKGYSEEAINTLLKYGVIYEPREGYLKPT
jgi:hypothetical protein